MIRHCIALYPSTDPCTRSLAVMLTGAAESNVLHMCKHA